MAKAEWRKSSYSVQENSECVEVAPTGRIRDSKNQAGPELAFGVAAVTSFLGAVKAGRFAG